MASPQVRRVGLGLGAVALIGGGLVGLWVLSDPDDGDGSRLLAGPPEADAEPATLDDEALAGRWVAPEGQDPDGVFVPWLELRADGDFTYDVGCGARNGSWAAGELSPEPVTRPPCAEVVDLPTEFQACDDGTLRFDGSLTFRELDAVDGPTGEEVVGDWLTPSGQFGISFHDGQGPNRRLRDRAVFDGCILRWSLGYGTLSVTRWDMCDPNEDPYKQIVDTLADGAEARLDGPDLFVTGDGRTIHLVRPEVVGFPEEVIGTWSATVPEAGDAEMAVTFEPNGIYDFHACNSGGGRWWMEGDTVRTYGFMTAAGCSGYRGLLDVIADDAPLPTGDEWVRTITISEEAADSAFNDGATPIEPGEFRVTLHRE